MPKKDFEEFGVTKLKDEQKLHYTYCKYPKLFHNDFNFEKPTSEHFKILDSFYNDFKDNWKQISDMFMLEDFANVCCRLGDYYFFCLNHKTLSINYYEKAIVCYKSLFNMYIFNDDVSNYTKNNHANVLYRYSLLKKDKTSNFNDEADKIWSIMPAASEGKIRGFVKTSYGIYYPKLKLKMVKVDDFYVGKELVSYELWSQVMGSQSYGSTKSGKIPVDSSRAVTFCKQLTEMLQLSNVFQIPTESQLQSASSKSDIYDLSNPEWLLENPKNEILKIQNGLSHRQENNRNGSWSLKPSKNAKRINQIRTVGRLSITDTNTVNNFPFRLVLSAE